MLVYLLLTVRSSNQTRRQAGGYLTGLSLLFCLLTGACAEGAPQTRDEKSHEQQFVTAAAGTVQAFADDPDMEGLRERAKTARAVLIVPEALRASFFVGVSSGGGILVVRDSSMKTWRGPAFYAMSGASFGLQTGADASAIICLVMTQRGLDSFARSSFKFGADASIAAGSDGNRVGAGTSPLLSADLILFARSKGAFMGISLTGVIVQVAASANQAYHGDALSPTEIFDKDLISTPAGADLLSALEALTR